MKIKDLIKAANMLDALSSEQSKLAADAIDHALSKCAEDDPWEGYHLSKEMLGAEQTGFEKILKAEEEIRQLQQTTDPALKRIFEMNPDIMDHLNKAAEELGAAYQKHYELTEGGTGMPTRMLEDVSPEEWEEEGEHKPPFMYQESSLYRELIKAADILDQEDQREAADIIDSLLKDAAPVLVPDYTPRSETRDMYDSVANNKDSLRGRLVQEVLMNDESHLETMRGKPKWLSTRYDPEMPGVTMVRVADGVYQSPVTRKIYDFNTGWEGEEGKYPGGSVKHQTPSFSQYSNPTRLFENRVQRMRRR